MRKGRDMKSIAATVLVAVVAGLIGAASLPGIARAQVIHGMPFWGQPYPAYYAHRIGGDRPEPRFVRHRWRHRGRSGPVLHAKD